MSKRLVVPSPLLSYFMGGEYTSHLAEISLLIAERSGYVLQGADLHLFLSELALTSTLPSPVSNGGEAEARCYAQTALQLPTCDWAPDHINKVA